LTWLCADRAVEADTLATRKEAVMHRNPLLQLLLLAGLGSALACREPAAPKARIDADAPRYTTTSDPNQTYTFVAQFVGDPNIIGDPHLLQGVLGEIELKLTRCMEPDDGDYCAVLSGKVTRGSGLSIAAGAVGDPNLEPILGITVDPFGPRDMLFFDLGGEGSVPAAVGAQFIGDPTIFTAILRNAAGQVVASGSFARAPALKR